MDPQRLRDLGWFPAQTGKVGGRESKDTPRQKLGRGEERVQWTEQKLSGRKRRAKVRKPRGSSPGRLSKLRTETCPQQGRQGDLDGAISVKADWQEWNSK